MTVSRHLKVLTTADAKTPLTIRVAFATTDRKHVNQHFGTAESLAIYRLDAKEAHLEEIVQFGQFAEDGNENKLTAKIDALTGCVAVYCQAIGASAVNQLRPRGIHAIKVDAGTSLTQLIRTLQIELRDGPSAWLSRALLNQQQEPHHNRFDAMAAEGWTE